MTISALTTDPQSAEAPRRAGVVELGDDHAVLSEIWVEDPTAVMLLATAPAGDRVDLARRMVSVGAHGMSSMGLGIDLSTIDDRVEAVLTAATGEAEAALHTIIDEARRSLGQQFDPEQRSSILARALEDFDTWREGFLRRLDPSVDGSTATELIARIQALVGPGGEFDRRIDAAFDLDRDDSSLAQLRRMVAEGFAELRRDLSADAAADAARQAEAERGTAHGFDFEDVVEAHLRSWAAGIQGCLVERTGTVGGDLAATARVGDFVVTLADGRRVVVEAKRHASITLAGSGGILAELDAAKANRRADVAVCIAGRDAFPAEVGRFNVYGDRILVVDEGDGVMTHVAMRWAIAQSAHAGDESIDLGAVADRIDRVRRAAEQLSGARRSVTAIRSSLDRLHEQLGGLREDILDQVADLDREISVPSGR